MRKEGLFFFSIGFQNYTSIDSFQEYLKKKDALHIIVCYDLHWFMASSQMTLCITLLTKILVYLENKQVSLVFSRIRKEKKSDVKVQCKLFMYHLQNSNKLLSP